MGNRILRLLPCACLRTPNHWDSRTVQAVRPRIPSTGRSTLHRVPLYSWPCKDLPVHWKISVVDKRLESIRKIFVSTRSSIITVDLFMFDV